jgi:hypothetical protein
MNDPKRRTFRPRNQRSGFRPRNNNGQNVNSHFHSNGSNNVGRNNGSMTNPLNVEKTAQNINNWQKMLLLVEIRCYMRTIFSTQNILIVGLVNLMSSPKSKKLIIQI